MALQIISHPSPNYDARPEAQPIDMVVLHYTGMKSGAAALARLCEETAKVSAHYLIEEDGKIYQMVDEENRAWHAGLSSWGGKHGVNSRSIGIEIVNTGHEWGYTDFLEPQIDAVIALLTDIKARRGIKPSMVLGHSDVAPERKEDPGEKFPWDRLARQGLAVGTFQGGYDAAGDNMLSYFEAIQSLKDIGYHVLDASQAGDGSIIGGHSASVLAFQRRFCPAALGQGLSPMTKAAIEWAKRKMV